MEEPTEGDPDPRKVALDSPETKLLCAAGAAFDAVVVPLGTHQFVVPRQVWHLTRQWLVVPRQGWELLWVKKQRIKWILEEDVGGGGCGVFTGIGENGFIKDDMTGDYYSVGS